MLEVKNCGFLFEMVFLTHSDSESVCFPLGYSSSSWLFGFVLARCQLVFFLCHLLRISLAVVFISVYLY